MTVAGLLAAEVWRLHDRLVILAAIGLAVLVAGRLARQVSRSIRDLNSAAATLGTGHPFQLPRVQWKEAEAADRALYRAKEAGKHRVEVAPAGP